MIEKRFGALSSSEDPQKLAASVTGIIKAIGGTIAYFGITSVTNDINTVADQIGTLIPLGFAFWGLCESTFGLIRKIVITLHRNLS